MDPLDPDAARDIMRAAEHAAHLPELDLTHGRTPLPQVEQRVRDAIAAGDTFTGGHRSGRSRSQALADAVATRGGYDITDAVVDETRDWLAADLERKRVAAVEVIEQAGILKPAGYRRGGKRRKSELKKLRDAMGPTLIARRNAR